MMKLKVLILASLLPVSIAFGEEAFPRTAGTVTRYAAEGNQEIVTKPFVDKEGHKRRLTDYPDKIVLINFWATWCQPCVAEMPALDQLKAQLGDKGLEIIPISLDRAGAIRVRPFYDQYQLQHLGIFYDAEGRFAKALGVNELPTTIVVSREGAPLFRIDGFVDWQDDEIVGALTGLLAE